jgi:hypothetical protein
MYLALMMRNIGKYFLWFVSVTILIQSCIPIEDKIGPQVNPFDIQNTYFYQDTINFSVIFTDNSGLDSGSLVIEKLNVSETSGPDAWFYLDTFDIRGRRIAPNFSIQVPEYKETGDYLITVFGFDEGGNPDTVKRIFALEADGKAPIFKGLDISLDSLANGVYTACRSEVVNFKGYVTDNLKINQIGFRFSNAQSAMGFYSTDSVTFSDIFQDFVRIPPDTPDSTLLTLEISAVDTFKNTTTQTFDILVACDDRPPTFSIAQSRPIISQNNRVKVTQGGTLSISEMFVLENDKLKYTTIYYNKNTEALTELVFIDLSSTSGDVLLNDFTTLDFEIPFTDKPGEIREITFVATDINGNQSELYKVYIDIIIDAPPVLILTNTYINNVETAFSEVNYVPVKAGDVLSFAGKVEELNKLDLLEMYWYEESLLPNISVSATSFISLPLNLTDYFNADTFTMPTNAFQDTNYLLIIRVVDSKGQETLKKYLFTVI